MKRTAAILALVLVLALMSALGLGLLHPFGNPRVEPHQGLNSLLLRANIPAEAKRVLLTKCADCHSNETRWPAYARLAPGSWLIERDITQARARMNLSNWEHLSPDQHDVLIAKILSEAKAGAMPPPQYRLVHWAAGITPADLTALRSMSQHGGMDMAATSAAGDAARGKITFQKRCTGCHAMDADREGPRLSGVFGRKAASLPGFDYSAGLKHSGLTWNEVTLEKWLTDPDLVAADTRMDFQVPRPQERADLIAYLKHPQVSRSTCALKVNRRWSLIGVTLQRAPVLTLHRIIRIFPHLTFQTLWWKTRTSLH